MAYPLKKFEGLDDLQISGMIQHAQRAFPFLEMSSEAAMLYLSKLMIETMFVLDARPTPIRASFDFLKTLKIKQGGAPDAAAGASPSMALFAERDMVFAIKMFGLRVRDDNGLLKFVPDNALGRDDEEYVIDSTSSAKKLEFYLTDVQRRTKIQDNSIESANNKLLREYREFTLSVVLADMVNIRKYSIGEARDYLRTECNVKDHEFVRIRAKAVASGRLQSRRSVSRANRRITIDEDLIPYVEETGRKISGRAAWNMTKTVNHLLRDFKSMLEDKERQAGEGKAAGKASRK